jgi:hypothetical protein
VDDQIDPKWGWFPARFGLEGRQGFLDLNQPRFKSLTASLVKGGKGAHDAIGTAGDDQFGV